jgi:hypothetical protein
MIPTDQPSGSSQILRVDLPSTFMAVLCRPFYRSTPIPETTEIFATDFGRLGSVGKLASAEAMPQICCAIRMEAPGGCDRLRS